VSDFLAGFEEGSLLVVEDLRPNVTGHDPRRRVGKTTGS
jgi:hypothetical protein